MPGQYLTVQKTVNNAPWSLGEIYIQEEVAVVAGSLLEGIAYKQSRYKEYQ